MSSIENSNMITGRYQISDDIFATDNTELSVRAAYEVIPTYSAEDQEKLKLLPAHSKEEFDEMTEFSLIQACEGTLDLKGDTVAERADSLHQMLDKSLENVNQVYAANDPDEITPENIQEKILNIKYKKSVDNFLETASDEDKTFMRKAFHVPDNVEISDKISKVNYGYMFDYPTLLERQENINDKFSANMNDIIATDLKFRDSLEETNDTVATISKDKLDMSSGLDDLSEKESSSDIEQ